MVARELGRIAYAQGLPSRALAYFDQAKAHGLRALTLARQGRHLEALFAWSKHQPDAEDLAELVNFQPHRGEFHGHWSPHGAILFQWKCEPNSDLPCAQDVSNILAQFYHLHTIFGWPITAVVATIGAEILAERIADRLQVRCCGSEEI